MREKAKKDWDPGCFKQDGSGEQELASVILVPCQPFFKMTMTCLFCNIANKMLPVDLLFENEEFIAFRDIHPQAPCHLLLIPKAHIATIDHANEQQAALLGRMLLKAKDLAEAEGISAEGYRLVFNVNAGGGQTVYHLHLHVLGGRQMMWPPG